MWLADSVSAPDCTDLTSGDQCNVVSTAGHTGSASILTCTLDGLNGSVSLIGGILNCSATGSAVDGIPNGMNHDGDGIAFIGNLVMPIVQTVTCQSTSHLPPCLVDPMAFLSETLHHFIPSAKPCLARAVRSSTTTPWTAWIAPPPQVRHVW